MLVKANPGEGMDPSVTLPSGEEGKGVLVLEHSVPHIEA